jgi:hypothetical protein
MKTTLAVFASALLLGAANYLLSVWPRVRAMHERLDELRLVHRSLDEERVDRPGHARGPSRRSA